MRLDKFINATVAASRQEAKLLIKSGRVTVDGSIIKDGAFKVNEKSQTVCLDQKEIAYSEYHYFMLNKPAGVVSATKDGLSDTVIDILKDENVKDMFPVGRLDKDTEGLLFITDDGALAHKLLSPKNHVDKVYLVKSDIELTCEMMREMESGVDIGDEKPTLPAKVLRTGDFTYELTIHEGRFHQVKRMFEAFGAKVLYLKRLSMGGLELDEKLSEGEYRRLSEDEIMRLKGLI